MTDPVITKDMIEFEAETYERDELSRFYVLYEGKRYRVQVMTDYDSRPDDEDCYSQEDIEAWSEDVWVYAEVVVTSVEFPDASDNLGGVEFGFPLKRTIVHNGVRHRRTSERYLAMVHPVPALIDSVRRMVQDEITSAAIASYLYS